MSAATARTNENEVTILARVLGNEHGQLPPTLPAMSSTYSSANATGPGCTTWP